uniref:Cyclic lactone autoinducer peptide n=1 Tax=Ascaris lumbricoides TaxID=6252 RepID=A0A0M3IQR5_ASCLU
MKKLKQTCIGKDATSVLKTLAPHVKAADVVMKKLKQTCIGKVK